MTDAIDFMAHLQASVNQGSDAVRQLHDVITSNQPGITPKMHWRLNYLSWSNVFCYGEENHINFNDMRGISTLIGQNHSGKSSMLNILLTILSGPERGVSSYLCRRGGQKRGFNIQCEICCGDTYYLLSLVNTGNKINKLRFYTKTTTSGQHTMWAEASEFTNRTKIQGEISNMIGSAADLLCVNVARQRDQFITERDPKTQYAIIEHCFQVEQYTKIYDEVVKRQKAIKKRTDILSASARDANPELHENDLISNISILEGEINALEERLEASRRHMLKLHGDLHPIDETIPPEYCATETEEELSLLRDDYLAKRTRAHQNVMSLSKPVPSLLLAAEKTIAEYKGDRNDTTTLIQLRALLRDENMSLGTNKELSERRKTLRASELTTADALQIEEEITTRSKRVVCYEARLQIITSMEVETDIQVDELDAQISAAKKNAPLIYVGGDLDLNDLFNADCAKCCSNRLSLESGANILHLEGCLRFALRRAISTDHLEISRLKARLAAISAHTATLSQIQEEYQKRLSNIKARTQIKYIEACELVRQRDEYNNALEYYEQRAAAFNEIDRKLTAIRLHIKFIENQKKIEDNKRTRHSIEKLEKQIRDDENDLECVIERLGQMRADLKMLKEYEEYTRELGLCTTEKNACDEYRGIIQSARVAVVRGQIDSLFERVNRILSELAPGLQLGATFDKDDQFGELTLCRRFGENNIMINSRHGSQFEQFITDFAFRVVLSENHPYLPQFLIFDEGFGCLDAASMSRFVHYLPRLGMELREQGRWLMIISHIDSMLNLIPTRLLVDNHGGEDPSRLHYGEPIVYITNNSAQEAVEAVTGNTTRKPARPRTHVREEIDDDEVAKFFTKKGERLVCVCGIELKSTSGGRLAIHVKSEKHVKRMMSKKRAASKDE